MTAPTPSAVAQLWTPSGPGFALATWQVTDDIIVGGSSVGKPVRTWAWNASGDPLTAPDGTGWVKLEANVVGTSPANPPQPTAMQTGGLPVPEGTPFQLPAADSADHDAFLQNHQEYVGYLIDLPPQAGITVYTDVYLQIHYDTALPAPAMRTSFSDAAESTSWTSAAQADFAAGDTEFWKLVDDSGGVATWRLREVPVWPAGPVFDNAMGWVNVYYGDATPGSEQTHLFVLPFSTEPFTGGGTPSQCLAISSLRMWREPVLPVTFTLHADPLQGVVPDRVTINGPLVVLGH